MQVYATGLHSTRVAESHTLATLLADSKLATIGIETPLEEGEQTGDFDNGFRWHSTVRPYDRGGLADGEAPLIRAYEVVVTVAWGEPDSGRSVSLTTLRLGAK